MWDRIKNEWSNELLETAVLTKKMIRKEVKRKNLENLCPKNAKLYYPGRSVLYHILSTWTRPFDRSLSVDLVSELLLETVAPVDTVRVPIGLLSKSELILRGSLPP